MRKQVTIAEGILAIVCVILAVAAPRLSYAQYSYSESVATPQPTPTGEIAMGALDSEPTGTIIDISYSEPLMPTSSPTPDSALPPAPIPQSGSDVCLGIENRAFNAHGICGMVQYECEQAIAAMDSVCSFSPAGNLCDPMSNPNCDICEHASIYADSVCGAAAIVRDQLNWEIRDLVPIYIQQGCMGCYLDIGGVNTYDVCTVNSPRPTVSGCQ